jgi:hypothetical protein
MDEEQADRDAAEERQMLLAQGVDPDLLDSDEGGSSAWRRALRLGTAQGGGPLRGGDPRLN